MLKSCLSGLCLEVVRNCRCGRFLPLGYFPPSAYHFCGFPYGPLSQRWCVGGLHTPSIPFLCMLDRVRDQITAVIARETRLPPQVRQTLTLHMPRNIKAQEMNESRSTSSFRGGRRCAPHASQLSWRSPVPLGRCR